VLDSLEEFVNILKSAESPLLQIFETTLDASDRFLVSQNMYSLLKFLKSFLDRYYFGRQTCQSCVCGSLTFKMVGITKVEP